MTRHLRDNWLDSCIEELDLPGSPWYEVKDCISKYLVERIRQEGLTKDELSKVRYLLGSDFTSEYKLYDSDIEGVSEVKRPNLKDEKLESLLKDLTLKSAKDANCVLQEDLSHTPECFQSTVALVTKVFNSSLELHMNATRLSQYTHYGPNTTVLAVNTLVDKEIEILGEAVVKILQKEPIRLPNIMTRLKGRLLPVMLRRLLYRLVLLRKQKQSNYPGSDIGVGVLSNDEEITQQGLREAFVKGLKEGMQKQKTRDATKCPLRHLIQSSVVEAYESIPGLKAHSSNIEIQRECARVLNILYTFSKSYQKIYILWLFPLQVTISHDRYAKEHDYELAMWLNCVVKSCFPISSGYVNEIVLKVWNAIMHKKFSSSLEQLDVDFSVIFSELGIKCKQEEVKRILEVELPYSNNNNSSDDDLQKLLKQTISTGSRIADESGSEENLSLYTQHTYCSLSHPALCIRKWLNELFVGVTDLPVTMFIWDQIFLYNWDTEVFEIACLALFKSVFKKLLTLDSVDEICTSVMVEPMQVKLHEIHRAWNETYTKEH